MSFVISYGSLTHVFDPLWNAHIIVLVNPPEYLAGKSAPAAGDGPGHLLMDGAWCGHGEPLFSVFDVRYDQSVKFRLRLPIREDNPPSLR